MKRLFLSLLTCLLLVNIACAIPRYVIGDVGSNEADPATIIGNRVAITGTGSKIVSFMAGKQGGTPEVASIDKDGNISSIGTYSTLNLNITGSATIENLHVNNAWITTESVGTSSITSAGIGTANVTTANIATASITTGAISNLTATTATFEGTAYFGTTGTTSFDSTGIFRSSSLTTIGSRASASDFPLALVIVSNGDTGGVEGTHIGVVAESLADDDHASIGIAGFGKTSPSKNGIGVAGWGYVANSADGSTSYGVVGKAGETHAGGTNIGVYGWADNGATNLAGQFAGSVEVTGDIYTTKWTDWTPTITVSGGTAPTYTEAFVNRYRVVGKVCYWYINWWNESGGTAGAGASNIVFTLPIAISSKYPLNTTAGGPIIGSWYGGESAGTLNSLGNCIMNVNTSQVLFRYQSTIATVGSMVSGDQQSSTVRFIQAQGFYEID